MCSDSLTALTSFKGSIKTSPRSISINAKCGDCVGEGLCVVFLWSPAHLEVSGNERVHKLDKEAGKRSTVENEMK